MKLGILAITITSSILLSACTKTDFQFGNTVPPSTATMHDDLGNVQENTQLNVLAPISENTPGNETLIPVEPVKIVQPKKPKSIINTSINQPIAQQTTTANPEPAPGTTQIAQPAPSNWQPNEALLIRGSELLTGLQKELGKKPTVLEMQKRLQSHMGLSATQAQQVIAVLGLS